MTSAGVSSQPRKTAIICFNERNKLIAEKAELEKQFQDILALRQKVQHLQFELNQSLLRKHGGKTGGELEADGK